MKPWSVMRLSLISLGMLTMFTSSTSNVSLANTDVRSQMSSGTEKLAFNLLGNLATKSPKKNILISPASIDMALKLAYNGAAGKTADEMAAVLGCSNIPLKEVNENVANLLQDLKKGDAKVTLLPANALWAQKGISLKPTFVQNGKTFFQANVSTMDFENPQAVSTINSWISDQTKGKIQSIVSKLDGSTRLVLTNAVYLKALWTHPFKKENTIANGNFQLLDGKSISIPMMCDNNRFEYLEEPGMQMVRLPYGRGQVAMYVLLPEVKTDFQQFIANLTPEKFKSLAKKVQFKQGNLQMPKFSIDYNNDLSSTLIALGMKSAFDPKGADFSGMADLKTPLFIGQVLHKTMMNVNENGTEAAAATAITMVGSAMMRPEKPFSMKIDHPFVVVIQDFDSSEILFLGTVVKPEKFD